MLLMIDNYDSFTYNLVHYLEELGEEICVVRNDTVELKDILDLSPDGIIISPGPKTPDDTGICIEVVQECSRKIPILGVCLGHQVIAYTNGAKVVKGSRPMHGKVSNLSHENMGVFRKIPSPIKVTRYHSLIVQEESLPEDFIITARSEDGVIMALKHRSLLLEGVQFHPEAVLTEYGKELLSNFVNWCQEVKHDA